MEAHPPAGAPTSPRINLPTSRSRSAESRSGQKRAKRPPIGRTPKLCLDRSRSPVPVPLKPRQSRVVGVEPRRSAQLPTVTTTGRDSSLPCASRRKQRALLLTVPRRLKSRGRRSLSALRGCGPERRSAEPAAVGSPSHGEQRR